MDILYFIKNISYLKIQAIQKITKHNMVIVSWYSIALTYLKKKYETYFSDIYLSKVNLTIYRGHPRKSYLNAPRRDWVIILNDSLRVVNDSNELIVTNILLVQIALATGTFNYY